MFSSYKKDFDDFPFGDFDGTAKNSMIKWKPIVRRCQDKVEILDLFLSRRLLFVLGREFSSENPPKRKLFL